MPKVLKAPLPEELVIAVDCLWQEQEQPEEGVWLIKTVSFTGKEDRVVGTVSTRAAARLIAYDHNHRMISP